MSEEHFFSKIRSIRGLKLDRRECVKQGLALGAAGFLQGAPFSAFAQGIQEDKQQGKEQRKQPSLKDWQARVSPIQAAHMDSHAFTGDQPDEVHRVLWSKAQGQGAGTNSCQNQAAPDSRSVNLEAKVVVIGGGISGLAAAYCLRAHRPLLLEQAAQFGGNSKGERWEGIDYSLGAAYLAFAEADDELYRNFYEPLGLPKVWRHAEESPAILGRKLYGDLWAESFDARFRSQSSTLRRHFRHIYDEAYPDIPPSAAPPASLIQLDRRSFRAHLEEDLLKEPLHPYLHTLLEYYCWSSFGGGLEEVSAAAGLNFYAGEVEGIYALPGGNSQVADRLLNGLIESGLGPDQLRTGTIVHKVNIQGKKVMIEALAQGVPLTIRCDYALVACPKFVARRIVADMPEDQAAACAKLKYRSYLVANVLLRSKVPTKHYDVYLLGEAERNTASAQERSEKAGATDLIFGHWAQDAQGPHSVLTMYRPFPYDGVRPLLLKDDAFEKFHAESAKRVPGVLADLGIHAEPHALRLSRWGHPMVLSEKGLIADGTLATASRSIQDRIFFGNQDNWALPAIETALSVALSESQKIQQHLASN